MHEAGRLECDGLPACRVGLRQAEERVSSHLTVSDDFVAIWCVLSERPWRLGSNADSVELEAARAGGKSSMHSVTRAIRSLNVERRNSKVGRLVEHVAVGGQN